MKKAFAITAALALLGLNIAAQAAITIDTVKVGDAGNAVDTTGYGKVDYGYNIGKYEVTTGQYVEFLNAVAKTDTYGLYNTNMWSGTNSCKIQRSGSAGSFSYSVASDWANRPVNYVSYWDACRFTNWLNNGQGTGDTETGAYTLKSYNGTNGGSIQRNADWTWAVTSEDEWYKAAYYKGGSLDAGYWLYPTQSDTTPGRDIADTAGNNANYYKSNYVIGSPYYRTEVGTFVNSDSAYGTFDQGGNVWEWNEAITYAFSDYAYRGKRGSSFSSYADSMASTASNIGNYPTTELNTIGFRVVQSAPAPSVPELPASALAMLGGLVPLWGIRRRKA